MSNFVKTFNALFVTKFIVVFFLIKLNRVTSQIQMSDFRFFNFFFLELFQEIATKITIHYKSRKK